MNRFIRKATHQDRVKLAHKICEEVKQKLGDDIRAFVIFASVARNEDVDYSDLEMMAIITEGYDEYDAEFMRDGIRCQVIYFPFNSALEQAGKISTRWPVAADQWHRFEPVYIRDDDDCIEKIRCAANKSLTDDEGFRKAIIEMMLILYESMTKLINSFEIRKVKTDIAANLFYVAKCSVDLVGLVNRHFYGGTRNSYEEAKRLPNLPRNYSKLLGLVLGEVETGAQTRYNAALELWDNITRWIGDVGLEWESMDLTTPSKKECK